MHDWLTVDMLVLLVMQRNRISGRALVWQYKDETWRERPQMVLIRDLYRIWDLPLHEVESLGLIRISLLR